ncbi:MAG: site-specific DNA-methyltransferase [Candidatus Woesearchaeota archaeon]
MERYRMFNHSSEDMHEIRDGSIDLTIADPPFNVGILFDGAVDSEPHSDYVGTIRNVMTEVARVIKPKGLVVMLAPEKVQESGQTYEYCKIFSKICEESGLIKLDSTLFKIYEDDEYCICLDKWDQIDPSRDCHSAELQLLVFGKERGDVNKFSPQEIYEYAPAEGHPCPFPVDLVKDLLDTYFTPGEMVLDPFMGTANLGVEVIKRCGFFRGYDQAKGFCDTAEKKLKQAVMDILDS